MLLLRIVPGIATLAEHLLELDRNPGRYKPGRCPHEGCGRAAGLRSHGCYERKPHRGNSYREQGGRETGPVKVPRYKCCHCGHTCSCLPSCLPEHRWYLWVVQAAVLMQLLAGGSMRACARTHGPDRRTVSRWWRWLQGSHDRFADLLRRRTPELGRAGDWREFWRLCLAEDPEALGEVMAWLHGQGTGLHPPRQHPTAA